MMSEELEKEGSVADELARESYGYAGDTLARSEIRQLVSESKEINKLCLFISMNTLDRLDAAQQALKRGIYIGLRLRDDFTKEDFGYKYKENK
jgi:hypothetical protein